MAGAQDPDGTSPPVSSSVPDGGVGVRGRLVLEGRRVAGARVVVRSGDRVVGRAEIDGAGAFRVPVPGPGRYSVELDRGSLPEGVRLRDGSRVRLDVLVQPTQDSVVLFPLVEEGRGSGGSPEPSTPGRLASAAVTSLIVGLIVGLGAVGLTITFATTKVVNFAHGEVVTFGALVAWHLNSLGVTLVVAGAVAVVAAAALGGALDRVLWRPLRRHRGGATAGMIVSIGLSLFLRNVYLAVFEAPSRPYLQGAVQEPWRIGPVSVLPKHVLVVAIAVAAVAVVAAALSRSREGLAIRAVSDDRALTALSSADVDRVLGRAAMVAAATGGLGGVLLGATQAVQWDMGQRLLLVMIAAVVVGGLGSVVGALAGGLLVGFASEMSTLWVSSQWKLPIALAVLVLVLLVRPRGVFGRGVRVG